MKRVPFYSQLVDWNGEDSGFTNSTEIERWQSNRCGIACLRMIVDYFTGVNLRYWDLLRRGKTWDNVQPASLPEWNKEGWIVPAEVWIRSFSGGFMEFYGAPH